MTQRTVVIGGDLDPLPGALGTPTRRVDACPLCRSSLHTTLARRAPYELRRCAACSLAYVTPRPSAGDSSPASSGRPQRRPGGRRTDAQLTWALAHGPAGGRALAAPGAAAAMLSDRGFDVHRSGLDILTDEVNDPARFGLIYLGEVVTEVPDPVELLLRARRRLAPGGRLVLHTADLDSLVARLRGARRLPAHHPERLQHFNAATLRRLLDTTGFALERMTRRELGRSPERRRRFDPRDRLTVVALARPEHDGRP
jgi:SAM-dependent methyltransferase